MPQHQDPSSSWAPWPGPPGQARGRGLSHLRSEGGYMLSRVSYCILCVSQCILGNVRDTTRIRRIRCIPMYPGRNRGAPPGYDQNTQNTLRIQYPTKYTRNTSGYIRIRSEYNLIENPPKSDRKPPRTPFSHVLVKVCRMMY